MNLRTIYIDVLIVVNIYIDFFLIVCTKKFLYIRVKFIRMVLGSVIGGTLSLVALLPRISFFLNILIDVAGACLIIFAVFGRCSLKNFLKRTAVYFSFSFSFCGIMIAIYSALKPNGMAIYNDVVYFNISPVVLIILTLVCYYILYIIKRLSKGVSGTATCNIEINIGSSIYTFTAKVDTGCNLKEPFSGDYVIVAEKELLNGYIPDSGKARVIPFDSLGGSGIIYGFKPDGIKIDGKEKDNNIYIGICENVLKGDIKALIPAQIATEIDSQFIQKNKTKARL